MSLTRRSLVAAAFAVAGVLYAWTAVSIAEDRVRIELGGAVYEGPVKRVPATQPATKPSVPPVVAKPPAKPSVPPPMVGSDTSGLALVQPIEVADGQTLDGKGVTIDARDVDVAFRVYGRTGITIKNYKVRADGDSHVIDVWQSKNVTIQNVEVLDDANYVVRIRRSGNVVVENVTAGNIRAYLAWVDSSDSVTLRNCRLTIGSRHETGIRLQYGATNVLIENCSIANTLNKRTALRIHDGKNITVRGGTYDGLVWPGPMGGGDGGQDEVDPLKRVQQLAYVTDTVLLDNVTINGSLGPQAGLKNFTMRGGAINVPDGTPFFGYAFNNVTWFYPDKLKLRPGDPLRGQPDGQLVSVKITQKQKTLNWGTNGPLRRIDVLLNGKPLK